MPRRKQRPSQPASLSPSSRQVARAGCWVEVVLELLELTLDPRDGRAVVVLEHRETGRVLPVWMDDRDASSVANAARGLSTPQPGPHDLLYTALVALGAEVGHAALRSVAGGVVRAELCLLYADERVLLEARASDAIAVALRAGAPILAAEELLDQVDARVREAEARLLPAHRTAAAEPVLQSTAERWNQLLEHLSREPLGPTPQA